MALDFPNSPAVGQTVTGSAGQTYRWDGTKWAATGSGTAYAPLASPNFSGNPTAPTAAYADNDTSIATTQFVQSAVAPTANNAGRNLIHNPTFTVAQRGAGPFTANGYTLDRWRLDLSLDTSGVLPLDISGVSAFGDEAAQQGLQVNAAGNAGAGSFTVVSQFMENVRRLSGKTVTVSFWAYATSGAPKIGVAATQYFGTGGSPSAIVLINGTPVTMSNTAARYSVTFTYPSVAGKTLGTNGDHYSRLALFFSSGATNNAFAGGIGVQTATFVLWGIQLEVGAQATPLDYGGSPQQQLAQCQRFFQAGYFQMTAYSAAGVGFNGGAVLPVTMRATPAVAFSGTSLINLPSISVVGPAVPGFIVIGGTATATGVTSIVTYFTASADL